LDFGKPLPHLIFRSPRLLRSNQAICHFPAIWQTAPTAGRQRLDAGVEVLVAHQERMHFTVLL
jgi:hypothetical protein